MGRLFGTDGVRGLANGDLTPELVTALAIAAAHVLVDARTSRPTAVVGRDPRVSGEMLEAAVCAGLASSGTDVIRVGVVPTPAVAYLVEALNAGFGVTLSASHNPMPDNGIKLFARGGHKLPDAVEDAIERALRENAISEWTRPVGSGVGRVRDLPDGIDRYLEHLLATLPHRLDGLRVVVDCAHGAASHVAPELYRRAGAEVVAIGAEPNGLNINDGVGSTHLEGLRRAVLEHGADVGIAHDGDADRCLTVAHDGSIVDGDHILAILALAMKEADTLTDNTLVVTVMSNLGLHQAMRSHDIQLVTTAVGDRYVLEALSTRKLSLGGEQSGHIVMPAFATTGDGLLTALHLLARVAATGTPLRDLAGVLTTFPQVLVNIRIADKARVMASQEVLDTVEAARAELGETGRVLLRPSGTEQLVRVMVEAPTQHEADQVAQRIAKTITALD